MIVSKEAKYKREVLFDGKKRVWTLKLHSNQRLYNVISTWIEMGLMSVSEENQFAQKFRNGTRKGEIMWGILISTYQNLCILYIRR